MDFVRRARPVWFFPEHVSLAFEAGFDHTSSGLGLYEGWLRTFTIAPQIGAGRKFFSRSVLQAFVTYTNWSQGLQGFVGSCLQEQDLRLEFWRAGRDAWW